MRESNSSFRSVPCINLLLTLALTFGTLGSSLANNKEVWIDDIHDQSIDSVDFEEPNEDGDIVGKLITGYQGWFSCGGDESPLDEWVHWAQGSSQPRPGYASFDLYPEMSEYTTTYKTGFANFGNGLPATLFSSYDAQVVNKHFEWMEAYGIDVAALQRFGHSLTSSKHKGHKDGIATMVKNAAETYGRKFYIMYDISSWDHFQSEIKTDWMNTITGSLDLLSSPAYAKENGKPVVCVWGIGSSGRPGDQSSWTDVITWLKAQGCYVIAGAHKNWRTLSDVKAACENADMISPWHVGTFSVSGVDSWGDKIAADMIHCKNLEIDYMPVLWPGFSWANWKDGYEDRPNHHPRMHGEFMWNQFYIVRRKFDWVGMTPTAYVAMFDEYDESTAIAKAAEDASMIPSNQWFLTLDADGVHCSSDFYLRLTGDGAKMLKDQIGITSQHPTPHTIEPAPPGVYPAEDAFLDGPTFSEYYPKYNGAGYVEFNNPFNDFIEWTVNVPTSEDYILTFRYSLKDTISRPLELKVNGSVEDSLDFPVTSYWSVWKTVLYTLALDSGDNTIRLTAIGSGGPHMDELAVNIGVTSITSLTDEYIFHQNHPNPFSTETTIRYDLSKDSEVSLNIYNLSGQKIRSLVVNEKQHSGYQSIIWNATNDGGEGIPGGLYIYMIRGVNQTGAFVKSGKMNFVK